MKTKRTTIVLILLGMLFAFPIEQVTAADFTGKIKRIRIRKRRVGSGYNISANITGGSEGSTVKVEIAPSSKESPKPIAGTFSLKVTSKDDNGVFTAEKDFACLKDDCLFGNELAEAGDKYQVTTTVLNKDGKPISKTTTKEVEIENEPIDIQVKLTKIRLRRRGKKGKAFFHIVSGKITGEADGTIIKVTIAPSSKESPTPIIGSFKTKITTLDKSGNFTAENYFSCENKDCLFGDSIADEGDKYQITATAYNSKNEEISKTRTSEVTVDIDNSDCRNKHTLENFSLNGYDFYAPYSDKNNSDYPLLVMDTNSTGDAITMNVAFNRNPAVWFYPSSTRMHITSKSSSNSESTVTTITPIYDKEKQVLSVGKKLIDNVVITSHGDTPHSPKIYIESITISTTVCGEKFKTREVNFNRIESVEGGVIEYKLKKAKETSCSSKDSNCTAPLNLSDGITLNSSINSSFQVLTVDGVKINQNDKPSSELEVKAIVEMKNCKGTSIYVAVPLKYNEKTGAYTSSKALALCNKTGMTVQSMNIEAKGKGLPLRRWTHVAITISK